MFSFFKQKDPSCIVTDLVWMSEAAKWKAIGERALAAPGTPVICWFDETYQRAQDLFAALAVSHDSLSLARECTHVKTSSGTPLFAEHHPLREKEEKLYSKMGWNAVTVCSSLEEPLFREFGSVKLITLMQGMGMKEEEHIGHPMITRSIRRAQDAIAKKLVIEQSASSPADWFRKNYKP